MWSISNHNGPKPKTKGKHMTTTNQINKAEQEAVALISEAGKTQFYRLSHLNPDLSLSTTPTNKMLGEFAEWASEQTDVGFSSHTNAYGRQTLSFPEPDQQGKVAGCRIKIYAKGQILLIAAPTAGRASRYISEDLAMLLSERLAAKAPAKAPRAAKDDGLSQNDMLAFFASKTH